MAVSGGSIERQTSFQTAVAVSGATCPITFPRAPKAGELIIIGVTLNGAGGGGVITPSGWQQTTTNIYAASARQVVTIAKFADGTEGTTITLTSAGSPTQWCALTAAYSGYKMPMGGSIINDISNGGSWGLCSGTNNGSSTTCTVNGTASSVSPRVGFTVVGSNGAWSSPTVASNSATSATVISTIDFTTTMSLAFIEVVNTNVTPSTSVTVTWPTSRNHTSGGFMIGSENARTMTVGVG